MAFVFKEGKMASNQLDSMLANAIVRDANDAEIACKDGSLVALGDLAADTTYAANGVEYDTYYAAAPAAATDEVAIIDYAGISEGDIMGNIYKMGNKLYDLEVPAGVAARVRRLALHDKFWLGESNFDGAAAVGSFAIAKAGSFQHEIKSALTAGQYNIKLIAVEDLTAGMASKGKLFLCEVVAL